jgi:hypothetical protein
VGKLRAVHHGSGEWQERMIEAGDGKSVPDGSWRMWPKGGMEGLTV